MVVKVDTIALDFTMILGRRQTMQHIIMLFIIISVTSSHTNRDHEIVRAQKKCPKTIPRHFQNNVVWSRVFECSVKSDVTGPSIKCYFSELLFMWSPHT